MRNELKSHPYLIQGTFYSCAFLVLGAIARYLHLAEGKNERIRHRQTPMRYNVSLYLPLKRCESPSQLPSLLEPPPVSSFHPVYYYLYLDSTFSRRVSLAEKE